MMLQPRTTPARTQHALPVGAALKSVAAGAWAAPALLGAALFSAALFGAPGLTQAAHAQISREGGPIDITADESMFLDEERMSRWIGKVDVRQGDARLLADRMDVFFAQSAGGGVGEIVKIEAVGSVTYVTPTEVARANRGVYYSGSQQIEMCGDVTLVVRNENTLTGECLIVEPEAGRSRIVAPASNKGARDRPRVRGVFFPSDSSGDG